VILKTLTSTTGSVEDLVAIALIAFILFAGVALMVALIDTGVRGRRAMRIFSDLLILVAREKKVRHTRKKRGDQAKRVKR
jgi:hypothetical protein